MASAIGPRRSLHRGLLSRAFPLTLPLLAGPLPLLHVQVFPKVHTAHEKEDGEGALHHDHLFELFVLHDEEQVQHDAAEQASSPIDQIVVIVAHDFRGVALQVLRIVTFFELSLCIYVFWRVIVIVVATHFYFYFDLY